MLKCILTGVLFVNCMLPMHVSAQNANGTKQYIPPSSEPKHLTVTDTGVFFTADDGVHGRELWLLRDPMGKPEMVKDLVPGSAGSTQSELMAFEDMVVFKGGTEGRHTLWVSDGTDNGTHAIGQGEQWGATSYRSPMFTWQNRFYMIVQDSRSNYSIWSFDRTTLVPEPLISSAHREYQVVVEGRAFVTMDDYFLFSASSNVGGNNHTYGIWRSDGTDEGTVELLKMLEAPTAFYRMGDEMIFQGLSSTEIGWELWKTDGTPEGTVLIKDIAEGNRSSSPGEFHTIKGGTGVYFSANDEQHGRELWYTDGTSAGTRIVADIFPGTSAGNPYYFISSKAFLFFIGTGEGIGAELWRTDGTSEGTIVIRDIYPGPKASEPYAFSMHKSRLFFSALDPDYGEELWLTDGQDPGNASMLADIYAGSESSFPYYTVFFKGQTIFTATHPLYGRELWRIASVSDTVELIADINDDGVQNPSSSPQELTATVDRLFFTSDDVEHGMELWSSDGTEEGTQMVKDIFPGRASSDPQELTATKYDIGLRGTPLGRTVYFRADDGTHGVELWKSDGTPEGTKMVKDISIATGSGSAPREFTPWGDKMFFVATDEGRGSELWVTQGDDAHIVKDIHDGLESSNPHGLVIWNNKLYFRADDGIHGEELWVSDGSLSGTQMVKDIVPLPVELSSLPLELVPFKDALYFALNNGSKGEELWRYTGRGKEINLFKDIATN